MATEDTETKEMLKMILTKISGLEQGYKSLEQGQKELKQDFKSLEQGYKSLEQGQSELKQDFKSLEQGYKNLEQRLEQGFKKLDQRIDSLEKRQNETFIVVKAIEHANQLHKAELDKQDHQVANLEGTFHQIGDVIKKI